MSEPLRLGNVVGVAYCKDVCQNVACTATHRARHPAGHAVRSLAVVLHERLRGGLLASAAQSMRAIPAGAPPTTTVRATGLPNQVEVVRGS